MVGGDRVNGLTPATIVAGPTQASFAAQSERLWRQSDPIGDRAPATAKSRAPGLVGNDRGDYWRSAGQVRRCRLLALAARWPCSRTFDGWRYRV